MTAEPPSIDQRECADPNNKYAGDGVKLAYGARDGQIVHVSHVDRGFACACACICPGCGAKLIARKGEQNQEHFSHPGSGPCQTAPETAIHMLAKQILESNPIILLPEKRAVVDHLSRSVAPSARGTLTDVRLETQLGDLIPNVQAPLMLDVLTTSLGGAVVRQTRRIYQTIPSHPPTRRGATHTVVPTRTAIQLSRVG